MRRSGRRLLARLVIVLLAASVPFETAEIASAGGSIETSGRLNTSVGSCGGTVSGGTFGTVWLRRLPHDLVNVKVRITGGLPNETYVVNVTCAGDIGTLQTDDEGRGTAMFAAIGTRGLRTSESIVIDVHLASDPNAGKAQSPPLNLPLYGPP